MGRNVRAISFDPTGRAAIIQQQEIFLTKKKIEAVKPKASKSSELPDELLDKVAGGGQQNAGPGERMAGPREDGPQK
ncbi:hypothetical protein DevBK_00045 [Devosia sp. BK]|uniref:hypothetical protein n=1 Tax=Devosia sp. BK TaxID=2871706 RepID=UPI0029397001|nr:hypothetical protein [Devosia sp. BK]MDV3249711.1 hypothetical protein [Devosia sp. BK]